MRSLRFGGGSGRGLRLTNGARAVGAFAGAAPGLASALSRKARSGFDGLPSSSAASR